MVAQEEAVQQLEGRVIQALRDWVTGVRQDISAKKTGEIDGFFFEEEDEYENNDRDDKDGFHVAGLDLEDADDDDEDHEDELHAPSISKASSSPVIKKTPKKKHGKKINKRDTENSNNVRETFLPADKVLMREEWSRWIAHWVHHSKLLILSHTLATQTLNGMSQIVTSGGMVTAADQRHWSWNLDKALATVMVASEMICGGPPTSLDTKHGSEFLSTLSMRQDSGETDAKAQKAMELALHAQKCIEAWNNELETILQRTASTM